MVTFRSTLVVGKVCPQRQQGQKSQLYASDQGTQIIMHLESEHGWRLHAIAQGAGCPGATPCMNPGSRRSAAAAHILETSRAPTDINLHGTGNEDGLCWVEVVWKSSPTNVLVENKAFH